MPLRTRQKLRSDSHGHLLRCVTSAMVEPMPLGSLERWHGRTHAGLRWQVVPVRLADRPCLSPPSEQGFRFVSDALATA